MPEPEETTTITTTPGTNQHESIYRQQKQKQQQQQQQQHLNQQQEEEQDAAAVVTKEQESTSSTPPPPNPQTRHIVVGEDDEDDDEIIFVATTSKKRRSMMKIIRDEKFQGDHADYDLLQFQLIPSQGQDQHQQQANLDDQDIHDKDLYESISDRKSIWPNRDEKNHNGYQQHLNGRNSIIGHVNVDDDDDDILFVTTKPISSTRSSSGYNIAKISSRKSDKLWSMVLFWREEQHHEGLWEILQVSFLLLIAAVGFVKFALSRTARILNEGNQKERIFENEKERTANSKNAKKSLPEIPVKTPDDVLSLAETSEMKRGNGSTLLVTKRPKEEETLQPTTQKARRTSRSLSTPSSMPPPLTDESSERHKTLMIESTNENLELESESTSVSVSLPPLAAVVNGEENGMILSHQTQKLTIQQSDLHQQHLSKKYMAKQLVKDIKMVQEVLEENNLDPSLAPNLAVSLQTSHHIVDAQNKLEYKRTIIDVHQRQLDRRLSERQHIETLRAARYDPDWRGKLLGIVLTDDAGTNFAPTQQNGRKRFAATTYLMSRISSIWWNVFWVQQLCRGLTPYMIQHYSGMFNNDQLFGTTTKTSYESARILGRMIQNLIWAALSHLCRCDDIGQEYQPSRVSIVESSRSNEGYTSFLDIFLTWTKPSFTSPEGDSSGYAWILLKSAKHVLFSSVVPVVEGCTCYGSCVLSISTLILASILIHQGFRVVSAPQTFHHAVNLFTLMAIWGPDQIIKVLLSSILFLTCRNIDRDQIVTAETDTVFWREVADLLTLTILIFVPLWEWHATRRVYYHTECQIDQATPADFHAKFKWGRYRLEQWVAHTQLIRFVVFSVYSSVILWGAFR